MVDVCGIHAETNGLDVGGDLREESLDYEDDEMDEAAVVRSPVMETSETVAVDSTYRPILLDIQLVETNRGFLIKELAFKSPPCPVIAGGGCGDQEWPPNDGSLHYFCYRHNPRIVPSHRTIEIDGRVHDRFSGLAIDCGDERYTNEGVVRKLLRYNLILLKGHNKKRVLCQLFRRCSAIVPEMPRIVNVDSATMEDDDREFCKTHLYGGAEFSFKYVYRRLPTYLRLLSRHSSAAFHDVPIYLSNVIVADERLPVLGQGRSLWICPNDHRCGQTWFSSQRCAALNVGLLETLWYLMRDRDFRDLVNAESHSPANRITGNGVVDDQRCGYGRDGSTSRERAPVERFLRFGYDHYDSYH